MKTVAVTLCAVALVALSACGSGEDGPDIQITGAPFTPAPTGLVQGSLLLVGGPAPGSPRPMAGTLDFRGPDGSLASTTVDATGKYAIELPPGDYTITGGGTRHLADLGACKTEKATTTITADGDTVANVYCSVP